MIIDLYKYLIVGKRGDMEQFFALAQRAGFLEFIGLQKKALEMPQDAKSILSAIKILKAHSGKADGSIEIEVSPLALAEQVVQWHEEREKRLEEERILEAEIARIQAFGNFSKTELLSLEEEGKRVFQFFCMKSDLAREMTLPHEVIYVGTEYDLDYFVSINKERVEYPKMIEILIDRPVGELKEHLHFVKEKSVELEQHICESAKNLPYLQKGLLEYLNEYSLKTALRDATLPEGMAFFAIEAWIPKTKIEALHGLVSRLDVFAEAVAIAADDRVPTYQENKGSAKVGEDLVHLYDIPAAKDKDPSLWVLVFFTLFFAMIISDAGYGLIFLTIALICNRKFKKRAPSERRFVKLMFILATACILWGVMTASFFGIEVGPQSPFRKFSILDFLAEKKAEYHLATKDDVYEEYVKEFPAIKTAQTPSEFFLSATRVSDGNTNYVALGDFTRSILIEIALLFGMIHICLSLGRYLRRNWVAIGWILFIVGGYLYFPSFLDATSMVNFLYIVPKQIAYPVGKWILFSGFGTVFIIALLQKKKWGALYELTNGIQVFADVLSYLRLYALALAGMVMASTFNELAVKVGVIGGIFVVLFGHVTNLSLTVMSGVIHGLRLNFLEWYHYSFEGGGRLFNPLRIRKIK